MEMYLRAARFRCPRPCRLLSGRVLCWLLSVVHVLCWLLSVVRVPVCVFCPLSAVFCRLQSVGRVPVCVLCPLSARNQMLMYPRPMCPILVMIRNAPWVTAGSAGRCATKPVSYGVAHIKSKTATRNKMYAICEGCECLPCDDRSTQHLARNTCLSETCCEVYCQAGFCNNSTEVEAIIIASPTHVSISQFCAYEKEGEKTRERQRE